MRRAVPPLPYTSCLNCILRRNPRLKNSVAILGSLCRNRLNWPTHYVMWDAWRISRYGSGNCFVWPPNVIDRSWMLCLCNHELHILVYSSAFAPFFLFFFIWKNERWIRNTRTTKTTLQLVGFPQRILNVYLLNMSLLITIDFTCLVSPRINMCTHSNYNCRLPAPAEIRLDLTHYRSCQRCIELCTSIMPWPNRKPATSRRASSNLSRGKWRTLVRNGWRWW
jgi:hypothetical protein